MISTGIIIAFTGAGSFFVGAGYDEKKGTLIAIGVWLIAMAIVITIGKAAIFIEAGA